MTVPVVQRLAVNGADEVRQVMDRVSGLVGIGHMPLNPAQRHETRQAAAAAYADGIAQDPGAGGFADHAPVNAFASAVQRFHDPERPVPRFAFLIAGDQQGDGAGVIGIVAHKAPAGDGHGGETGFHVRSAACDQTAFANLRSERVDRPILRGTRRHHVGVAGKAQHRAAVAPARPEVVHLPEPHRLQAESRFLKDCAEQGLAAVVRGRHRTPPDKVAGQIQYILVPIGHRRAFDGGMSHLQRLPYHISPALQ